MSDTPIGRVLRAKLSPSQRLLLLAICERAAELPLQISDLALPLALNRGDAERDGKALYHAGAICPGSYNPSVITLVADSSLVEDGLAVCSVKKPVPVAAVVAPKKAAPDPASRKAVEK